MDLQQGEVRGADAASSDNIAVFPPLRRGIKNMLMCVAMTNKNNLDKVFVPGHSDDDAVDNAFATNSSLRGYFGQVKRGFTPNGADVEGTAVCVAWFFYYVHVWTCMPVCLVALLPACHCHCRLANGARVA